MRSLFVRVFVALLAAVAVSHLVGTLLWTVWLRDAQRDEIERHTRTHLVALAAKLEKTPEAERQAVVDTFERDYVMPVRLLPEGEVPTASDLRVPPPPGPGRPHPPSRPRSQRTLRLVLADGSTLVAPLHLPPPPPPRPTVLALEVLLVLLVVAVVGWGLARPLVQELQDVERTVGRLAAEDLDARVQTAPAGALAPLAEGINTMAERLQRSIASQRQLLQAVSHELRTPNARIRFALEGLRDTGDPAERERLFSSIDEDIAEADALLEELLTYLRFDVIQADAEPFAPGPVLEEVASRMRDLAREVAVRTDLPEDLPDLIGSPRWFGRAIENLVTNAIRHAGSTVRIGAVVEGGTLRVDVDDDGTGVPDEARERLFEPFASGDPSRSKDLGGVGLGLAIVRRIAELHHGSVVLLDAPLGGARFRTTWPLPA